MERILQILAAAFLIFAAYFLWRGVTDWSFVCGVLAASSFFLSMRFQIKARMAVRSGAEVEKDEEDEHSLAEPVLETAADKVEKIAEDTTLHS